MPEGWSAPDAPGREPGEATALLLVAALAGGVVLASDVFESGGVVDRLLFGTLLGLDFADLALSASSRCSPSSPRSRWGAPGPP